MSRTSVAGLPSNGFCMQREQFMEYVRAVQLPDVRVTPHEVLVRRTPPPRKTSSSKKQRRTLSEADKKAVAALQQWRCARCMTLLPARFEVDHIDPFHATHNDHYTNLQALCPNCHASKTEMDRKLERPTVWEGFNSQHY